MTKQSLNLLIKNLAKMILEKNLFSFLMTLIELEAEVVVEVEGVVVVVVEVEVEVEEFEEV